MHWRLPRIRRRATVCSLLARRWSGATRGDGKSRDFAARIVAADYCVKRIVGLPGEIVDIRNGDVYINGEIARKTLAEQRVMAILVHDTEWKPEGLQPASSLSQPAAAAASLPTDRWHAGPASDWRHTESGWTLRSGRRSDWLEFASGPASRMQPGEILDGPQRDDDPYNLNSSRKLNDVADLLLVAQVSAVGDGQLNIRASYGSEQFLVTLRPNTGQLSLSRNGKIVDTVKRSAACCKNRVNSSYR